MDRGTFVCNEVNLVVGSNHKKAKQNSIKWKLSEYITCSEGKYFSWCFCIHILDLDENGFLVVIMGSKQFEQCLFGAHELAVEAEEKQTTLLLKESNCWKKFPNHFSSGNLRGMSGH